MSSSLWGLFFIFTVSALCIAAGVSLWPVLLFGMAFAFLLALRSPYGVFYSAVALLPLLGLMVSIPTGQTLLSKRAFGGSIDVTASELVFAVVLVAWGVKTLMLWRRQLPEWKPRFALVRSYAGLWFAHILSAFSPLAPDKVLVAKFAMRPVLFDYLAYIFLPLNLIRAKRRLVSTLTVLAGVGVFASCVGLVSLLYVDQSSQFIRRAHPLPIFGVSVLGDNHNLLAELLVVTTLTTFTLIYLVKRQQYRRLAIGAALLQGLVGLLTFSRTAWIVFVLEALCIAWVEYRDAVKRYAGRVVGALLLVLPLVFLMARISTSTVATSSNSTRLALLEISWQVFQTSPWIGGGAGTFVDRVGSASVFRLEYGDPLDAHGFLQKLATETGLFGLLAYATVVGSWAYTGYRAWKRLPAGDERHVIVLLYTAAGGALVYQLFNTNYWTGKMWFPVGLALAAERVFVSGSEEEEV